MKNKYRIEVQACRRVRSPIFGPDAHTADLINFDYPYGRGCAHKNRDKAYIEALLKGIELMPDASYVAIADWRGLSATCHYIKDTQETFSTGWPDERTQ